MKNAWKFWRPIYSFTWAVAQRSSYEHFCRYTSEKKGCLILDVGTGTGEYIKNLGKENIYVFTDIDPVALGSAQRRAERYLPQEKWRVATTEAKTILMKTDNPDVISAVHVVSVVDNPQELISMAMEKLKPGGALLIYISRFSRRMKFFCNPVTRRLGFSLLDVEEFLPSCRKERAGLLNYCYIVEKQ